MLTQGLEVRAAVDEVDVGAGLGEPTPEIAPNPAGAVNRDPHGFTLPSSGHYRPLLVAGCVLNDDPASDLPDRDRCTPHLSKQVSARPRLGGSSRSRSGAESGPSVSP